jgi:hypothetical protein
VSFILGGLGELASVLGADQGEFHPWRVRGVGVCVGS